MYYDDISHCFISLGSECPKDCSEESGGECMEGVTMDCCEDDGLHYSVSSEGESSDSWESECEVANPDDLLFIPTPECRGMAQKKHGHDTYFVGSGDSDVREMAGDSDDGVNQKKRKGRSRGRSRGKDNPQEKGKCGACGPSTHRRSSHKHCPFHKGRAKKEAHSPSLAKRSTPSCESGNESIQYASCDSSGIEEVQIVDTCTCGPQEGLSVELQEP